jgi:hypothetical protein
LKIILKERWVQRSQVKEGRKKEKNEEKMTGGK